MNLDVIPNLNRQMLIVVVPILVFGLFWIISFLIFKIDMKVRGQTAFDARIEGHKPSFFISRDFLLFIVWLSQPVKNGIIRLRITPNQVTVVSVLFAVLGALAAALGWFAPAGMLFIIGALCDVFDGWVARETNQVSAAGSFLDSLLDRVSELLMFGGYIYYYAGRIESAIALVALGASQIFSYARAKGEALQISGLAKAGVMGRAERVVSLSIASVVAPIISLVIEGQLPRPSFHIFAVVLTVVALFSVVSLISRSRLIYLTLKQRPAQN